MADGGNDRLGIFIGLAKGLIWPCTMVLLVFALRTDIISLLTRVSKVNVGGATLELVEAVQRIDKQIAKSAPVTRQVPREDPRARRAMTENGLYVSCALQRCGDPWPSSQT